MLDRWNKQNYLSGRYSRTLKILFVVVLLYVLFLFFVPVKVLNFIHDDVYAQVELAVVLFHDFDSSGKGLNNETKRRIHHALSLVRSDNIQYLLVSGGNRPDKGFAGADLMAQYIRNSGDTGAERIIVENKSRDSVTNLENISRIMDGLHLTSAGLVSSPLHLLRIKSTDKGLHGKFYFFPYDAVSCLPPLSRKDFWYSMHYNLAVYVVSLILPERWYNTLVQWVREHTDL